MADKSKLEQMLEKLVNNDREGADSLFHEFVIEKSRGIYEKMLEDDLNDLEVDEATDEEVDEASHKKDDKKSKKDDEDMKEANDEEVDEASDDEEVKEESDEEVDEASDEEVDEASDEDVEEATDEKTDENFGEITSEADPMGGDAADDMIDDMEDDGEKGDMDGDDAEEIEDRVVDLEDALDDLKDQFQKMMSDKEGGDDDMDDMGDDDAADMDMDDEEKEDEALEPTSELGELPVEEIEPAYEGKKSEGEVMREYVNKIAMPKGEDNKAKSPVAGANNMGGTTANIVAGGEGDTKGSAMTPKEDNAGNVNVPGGKASKSMSNAKGHGAEKKGAGESGTDKKSVIGS